MSDSVTFKIIVDAQEIQNIVLEAIESGRVSYTAKQVNKTADEPVRPFPVGSIIRWKHESSSRYDRRVDGYYKDLAIIYYVDLSLDDDPHIIADATEWKLISE